jgi:hypothetical protein
MSLSDRIMANNQNGNCTGGNDPDLILCNIPISARMDGVRP